jgi:hypothetical protein
MKKIKMMKKINVKESSEKEDKLTKEIIHENEKV